jgi:O-antigen/teichoic acid export membrane protein
VGPPGDRLVIPPTAQQATDEQPSVQIDERAEGRELFARLKELAGTDTGQAATMAIAVMGQNLLGLVFTVVFARILGKDGYGSLAALVAAFLILSIPGTALQVTVAREVSGALATGEAARGAAIRGWMRSLLFAAAGVTVVSLLLRGPIGSIIGVDAHWAAGAVVPTATLWLVLCVQRGALQGFQRYRLVGASLVGEAATRLIFGLILVGLGLDIAGAYLGTTMSIAAMAAMLGYALHRELDTAPPGHTPPVGERLRDLAARAWAPLVALALIAVLQNIDVIVVKHRVSDDASSAYAAAAVAAKVMVWIAVGLGMYLLPEATRRTSVGRDARPVLVKTLAVAAACAVPIILIFVFGGHLLLDKAFGKDFATADKALPILGVAMTFLAATYLCVQYLLALHRSRFVLVLAAGAILDPLLLLAAGHKLTSIALVLAGLQAVLAAVIGLIALRSRPSAATSPTSGAAAVRSGAL